MQDDHRVGEPSEAVRAVQRSRRLLMPILLGIVSGAIALTGVVVGVVKGQLVTTLLNGLLFLGIVVLFLAIRWMRSQTRRP